MARKKESRFGRIDQLHPSRAGARRKVSAEGLTPSMRLLRQWQQDRLATTHADLLHSDRFGPACRFFLSDIYAPQDFSQRDQDGEHVYEVMRRFLPDRMLVTLGQAVDLNRQTRVLDDALLDVLTTQLGMQDALTPQMYAEAYRLCDNYEDRARQIDMVRDVGEGVDRLAHRPFVASILRLAHGPAHRTGWGELQGFLERGFEAFRHMGDAQPFLDAVCGRELQILDQIYAKHPDPFAVTG